MYEILDAIIDTEGRKFIFCLNGRERLMGCVDQSYWLTCWSWLSSMSANQLLLQCNLWLGHKVLYHTCKLLFTSLPMQP